MFKVRSFKQSVILGFTLAAFVPLLFFGYFSYSYLGFRIEDAKKKSYAFDALAVTQSISYELRIVTLSLNHIVYLFEVYKGDIDLIGQILDRSLLEQEHFVALYYFDKTHNAKAFISHGDGDFTARYGELEGQLSEMKGGGEPRWTRPFFDTVSNTWILAIEEQISNGEKLVGIVDLSEIVKLLAERASQLESSILVLDVEGNPLFYPDFLIDKGVQLRSSTVKGLSDQSANGYDNIRIGDERYIGGGSNVLETGWKVVVMQPVDVSQKPVREMTKYFLLAALMAVVLVIFISMSQLRRLFVPMKNLRDEIEAVAGGDYSGRRFSQTSVREFEEITSYFRKMAHTIERREQLLEINEERLIALLEIHDQKHLEETELLKFALEQAVHLTRSEIGCLRLLTKDESAVAESLWSEGSERFKERSLLGKGDIDEMLMCHRAVETRQRVFMNATEAERNTCKMQDGRVNNIRQLCVPIFDQEKIVAVISVMQKRMGDYDETDARQLALYLNHTWDILQQKRSNKDKERLAEQLAQAQKLEAIGTLAGGIAHDFNNVLMVILGNTEVAKGHVDEPELISKDLDAIFSASIRARDLVKQILAFSRKSAEGLRPMDIGPVVQEATKLLRSLVPANIEIDQQVCDDSRKVVAEQGQINQIIMNLSTNALQAMEGNNGRLSLGLSRIILHASFIRDGRTVVPAGEYMMLSIKDNGRGIPEEIKERIFEPYFTTREKERGTGLGLAVVHGIVKGLGGALDVESEFGKGSEFKVYLPVKESDLRSEEEVLSASLPGGDERICYVDDDEAVAFVNSKILENLGYEVTTFTSSTEAYEHIVSNPEGFDLVITDMAMPEITGDKLAEKLISCNPQLPIILCTGYSEQVDREKAMEIGIREMVFKPLTKLDLSLTVRKVLGYKSKI